MYLVLLLDWGKTLHCIQEGLVCLEQGAGSKEEQGEGSHLIKVRV